LLIVNWRNNSFAAGGGCFIICGRAEGKKMKKQKMKKQNFTLIEMLVVIAIAAILMALGWSIKPDMRLSAAAGIVKGTFDKARSLAVKEQKCTVVYFLDGDANTTPYAVALWFDGPDDKYEDSKESLPGGVSWNTENGFTTSNELNSAMRVKFAPAGNAWADHGEGTSDYTGDFKLDDNKGRSRTVAVNYGTGIASFKPE
jgi:prepilin-type N-terminal cleavage/methylation domain-containing protein